MSATYDCREDNPDGINAAVAALRQGDLVVLPTDTVYGIAADAFSPSAVVRLLEAKGRSRDTPTPVLVPSTRTIEGLVDTMPTHARALVEAFWPGGLTIVVRHAATLAWDLGETRGTVALRMPLDPVALQVLEQTGPLAVSSANRTGLTPATDAAEAARQLGNAVAVYLDGGSSGEAVASTILDLTGDQPHVLRHGAISLADLQSVVPELRGVTDVFRVLHVCTGNICRSPMAERLMHDGLAQRLGERAGAFVVESAGTMGFTGDPMQPFSHSTLAGYGVDGSQFRARLITPELVASSDLVLGATREHRAAAVTMNPKGARRTFTLREFDRLLSGLDPTTLPTDDLVTRARAVVEAAASARGLIRPDAPEDDDITDPYRGPEQGYVTCGRLIRDCLERPLDLLAG